MAISKDLLDILACAFCKNEVRVEGDRILCTNAKCGLKFRIEDDIPVMLIDEADRPCPKCGEKRDWNDDVLKCPKCGEMLAYERK
ncbi:MAG: Trm112 family protein [Planctomycetota bacterium]|jgi:uncharacterized protein YbaR (Trm112 family)